MATIERPNYTDLAVSTFRLHSEGGSLPDLLDVLEGLESAYEALVVLDYLGSSVESQQWIPSDIVGFVESERNRVRAERPLQLVAASIESPGWFIIAGVGRAIEWIVSHISQIYGFVLEHLDPRDAARKDLENDDRVLDIAIKMKNHEGISDAQFREACSTILEDSLTKIGRGQEAGVISTADHAEAA